MDTRQGDTVICTQKLQLVTAVVVTCAASWAPATWAACDMGLVITFQSDILLCREWW